MHGFAAKKLRRALPVIALLIGQLLLGAQSGLAQGGPNAGGSDSSSAPEAPPAGTSGRSIPTFSGRSQTYQRNAPERDDIQAIGLVKYVNALIGGFEQGAGFAFGVELTTADKIKGAQFYARALGSSLLYRQAELGVRLGPANGKTRGEVWFDYLRRTQDHFYGIGPSTSRSAETNFSTEARSLNAVLSRKLLPKLEAGLYATLSNTGAFRGESDSEPDINLSFTGDPRVATRTRYAPGLNSNVKLFAYGGFAEWDLRNNDHPLTQGAYLYGRLASVDGLKNGNSFSDYGWIETELDARGYVPLFSPKTSLALRGYAELKEPKRGSQIPFYELSFLGGRRFLRGFDNYRYRANNLLLFSSELRQTVWTQKEDRGLDVFAFADTGQVWGDARSKTDPRILANDSFRSSNWRIGVGGGGQYRMNKNVAIRLEVGSTSEHTQVYFSVSRGF